MWIGGTSLEVGRRTNGRTNASTLGHTTLSKKCHSETFVRLARHFLARPFLPATPRRQHKRSKCGSKSKLLKLQHQSPAHFTQRLFIKVYLGFYWQRIGHLQEKTASPSSRHFSELVFVYWLLILIETPFPGSYIGEFGHG